MKRLSVLVGISVLLCCCEPEEAEPLSCEFSEVKVVNVSTVSASACGVADGMITVHVEEGAPPYTYTLGNKTQSSATFSNVSSGMYSVQVTDKNGCRAEAVNVVVEAVNLSFTHEVTEDTDCTGGNGSVTVSILQGVGPFSFSLNDGEFQSQSSFHGLRTGAHVLVLQSGDCVSRFNLTIPKGDTGTSWTNDIKPLIEKSCAMSGCHNGVSRPDLRVYEAAMQYAPQIKILTADRSMPFTGTLTQQQIDLIGCWVDEGARQD